jgi:hypothetical protein
MDWHFRALLVQSIVLQSLFFPGSLSSFPNPLCFLRASSVAKRCLQSLQHKISLVDKCTVWVR